MSDELQKISGYSHENPHHQQHQKRKQKHTEKSLPLLPEVIRDVVILRESSEPEEVTYRNNPNLKTLMLKYLHTNNTWKWSQ